MKASKILIALFLTITVLLAQVGAVFAAPANQALLLTGIVTEIKLETDVTTAVTTVLVTIEDENKISKTVRLSQKTALKLGLLIPDVNGGVPVINSDALRLTIQINPKTVISNNEADLHPVADALATFFSDIIDYDTIMQAHEEGIGFGVIAQALWLTQKLEGDSEIFKAILQAKETGNYDAFVLKDGTTPKNWGQFRKAVLDKKDKPEIVLSNKDKDKVNNGNNDVNVNKTENKDKDKGNNNGNNDENKDKDKDKGNGNTK